MATATDYFSSAKPSSRTRPSVPAVSPSSPRTPILGRSISAQFGSPGAFRGEHEDTIVYELSPRHLSAGFAGESRPRCELWFGPLDTRRTGDYRLYDEVNLRRYRDACSYDRSVTQHELYSIHLQNLDLGLVEDRIERLVRRAHSDHLQLDSKSRKAVLVVPSLLPTPLLEIVVRVLFNHFSQPPSITLLTTPVMACVGAGLRSGLVVDVGWEESVVTAVGEYREVLQRRSVRAVKLVTRAMAKLLDEEIDKQLRHVDVDDGAHAKHVTFEYAEDVTRRLAWCRPQLHSDARRTVLQIPAPSADSKESVSVSINDFAQPVETTLFGSPTEANSHDNHELPLNELLYNALLSLSSDLRTVCMSRIVLTGCGPTIPGLHARLLQELDQLVNSRGWDSVQSYGSASTRQAQLREAQRIQTERFQASKQHAQTLNKTSIKGDQSVIPAAERVHDDQFDPISSKAERGNSQARAGVVHGVVRGVRTLGAWSGASLVSNLRIKGVCEIERDEMLKHGLSDAVF